MDGEDLRSRPLLERKRILRQIVPRRSARLLYAGHERGKGVDLFSAVCLQDIEGIVANARGDDLGKDQESDLQSG